MTHIWPTNSSLSKGIYWIEYLSRLVLGKETSRSWTDSHQWLATLILVGIIFILAFFARKKIEPIFIGITFVAVASMVTPVSWSYYLVFAIPIAALVVRDPLKSFSSSLEFQGILDGTAKLSWSEKVAFILLLMSTLLTLTRVLTPILVPGTGYLVVYTSAEIISPLWIVTIICLLGSGILRKTAV